MVLASYRRILVESERKEIQPPQSQTIVPPDDCFGAGHVLGHQSKPLSVRLESSL